MSVMCDFVVKKDKISFLFIKINIERIFFLISILLICCYLNVHLLYYLLHTFCPFASKLQKRLTLSKLALLFCIWPAEQLVDNVCLIALHIFICAFGTLYLWVQCIITTYMSTLFYDKHLLTLRQFLANTSFLILIIMAIFGTVTSFLPKAGSSVFHVCFIITSLCSYSLTAFFCIFLMSFEKEYEYFAVGLRSELLLDDACSLNNTSLADVDSLFGTQDILSSTISSAIVIKGSISCGKIS